MEDNIGLSMSKLGFGEVNNSGFRQEEIDKVLDWHGFLTEIFHNV